MHKLQGLGFNGQKRTDPTSLSTPGTALIMRQLRAGLYSLLMICVSLPVLLLAGEADVVDVKIRAVGDREFRIDVTVKHADAGWDHYANRWEVLSVDGEILGTRVLAHPHDNEQPFTRSLVLNIPAEHTHVVLRAGDSVHDTGGAEMKIEVPSS